MTADDKTADSGTPRWLGLIAASMGLFLTSLDMTVNVALPDITRSFGSDAQTVQWIIICYVGGSTGMQLSLGSAADAYGLKRFYLIGVGVYTLAVLLIGLAPWLTLVFALRLLQAVGNSLIMVSAPALVTRLFSLEARGKALGLMTGLATLGMVVGALGGGALVDAFGWRIIFIGRVPLGGLTVLLALVSLQESTRHHPKTYDFRGAVVLFVGLVAFILFLTLGGRQGWGTPPVLLLLLTAGLALTAFFYIEKTAVQPVFDLSLLKHRRLVLVVAAAYLMFLAIFVNWFILPFYVSDILKVNAKTLGFLLMLMPVVGTMAAPLGGWLSDRMSPAYLTTLALIIIAATMWCFTSLHANSSVAQVTWRMGAVGLGMGLFQAANATLIMSAVPSNSLGTGGALLAMSRSMGTVSSVALMGAWFARRLDLHTLALAPQGMAGALSPAPAFVLAFKDTYWVSFLLAGMAIFVSLGVWPRRERKSSMLNSNSRIA